MSIAMVMHYVIDLDGPLKEIPTQTLLVEGDKDANTILVEVMDRGQPADLTGCTAVAYFVRQTGDKVRVEGTVEGNAIRVTLIEQCYYVPGCYAFMVSLTKGDALRTVLWLTGRLVSNGEGRLVDPESTLPSVDELVQYIEAMDEALEASRIATNAANEAAEAAQQFVGLEVKANTLPAGLAATAIYDNGVLTLGLPRGEKGDTGSASAIKVNNIEGVDDNITITGAEIPVSAKDNMSLATAVEKAKSFDNMLTNSNFMAPINQRGQTAYTGQGYTIDRWKGVADDAEVTVTENGITVSGRMRQSVQAGEYAELGTKITAAVGMADGTTKCIAGDLTGITADWVTVWIENDQVHYELASGEYKWAALYKGEYTLDTLPPYVSKGVAHETLECQRYYQRLPISRQPIYCSSATAGAASIVLPIPMWRLPMLTAVKAGTIRVNGVSAITVRSISLEALQGNVLWLNTTHNSTANTSGYTGTWNGGEITLEAEL